MQRPAEVIGRALGVEIRPERVKELLAMQSVAGFQGQEFDNSRGPALSPDGVRDEAAGNADLEAAQ
jgi:hypothetical protein